MEYRLDALDCVLVLCLSLMLAPVAHASNNYLNTCKTGVENDSSNTQTTINSATQTAVTTWQCTYPFIYGSDYNASARFQCVPVSNGAPGAPLAPIGMQFAGKNYVAYSGSNPMEVKRDSKSGEIFLNGFGLGLAIGVDIIQPEAGTVADTATVVAGVAGSATDSLTKGVYKKKTDNLTIYCKQSISTAAGVPTPALTPQQQKTIDQEEYQNYENNQF